VAKARELICAGLELGEVAQVLGFSDQPHLTREFKKVYGVPPGVLARSVGSRSNRGRRSA
jgi:AraC-like DNA-binding protein